MIECLKFSPVDKNTLIGFADVKVDKWGLIITGISLHSKNGAFWVSMPSKPYEKDGEKKFMPIVRMEKPEHQKELLRQIQEAVLKKRSSMIGSETVSDDFQLPIDF